ncbi:diphthine--ammonia ligase [Fulvivirgaceae bacterium BMA12]|uniref:Diphthine--ammonia ligase n=1 Tax=Agaribacillus aureus TaxID=3051825 RepID=A0ABT8L380_9BACT|nr:diphthine--ammonia ligase [Fulvivirgaceae bacterium BMA12]
MRKKAIFNWSGGKDSALALHQVLQGDEYEVGKLLTSVNTHHKRVSMHGVRETLLEQQAASIGIPLEKLQLPENPDMDHYNKMMHDIMFKLRKEGFTHSVFGDIFLEDLRQYREERLAQQGFSAHFPIWKQDTKALIRQFLALGFKTVLVCIKSALLDKSFAGRIIDEQFLKDLPENVDPCGENGEFHTFVFDGPIFRHPIPFEIGEKVYREYEAPKSKNKDDKTAEPQAPMGFWFCDLLPG